MTSPLPVIWLFTEHKNATYDINFCYPSKVNAGANGFFLQTWDAQAIESSGVVNTIDELHKYFQLSRPVAAVFSRYVQPFGARLIAEVRALGVPTLFHLDDLLQEVPFDLGLKYTNVYNSSFRRELDNCLSSADGLLVSTQTLANELNLRLPFKPLTILQGVCYLDAKHWRLINISNRLRRIKHRIEHGCSITVGYMGSASHSRDLLSISPQIKELLQRNSRLRFETMGIPMPDMLLNNFPERVRSFQAASPYSTFLKSLFELGWDVGLAPLVKDRFNECKTATKFVEYTTCGIPTVAQRLQSYQALPSNAIMLAEDNEWVPAVESLVADRVLRDRQLRMAKKYCLEKCSPATAAETFIRSFKFLSSTAKHQTFDD